jgi:hypothetical protein
VRKQQDVEKARYWQAIIREAARRGMSIRAFCRLRKLKEAQFYWWQRRLKEQRLPLSAGPRGSGGGPASFALVSEGPGRTEAGIELVLASGRKLRIRRGVDEATLRTVLAAAESA